MKYIKKFERFSTTMSPMPATKPAPTPTPTPVRPPKPETPTKPTPPSKPRPARPIETPSTDPGPLAKKKKSEEDVVRRLEMELEKKGQDLGEFVEKNKKARKK